MINNQEHSKDCLDHQRTDLTEELIAEAEKLGIPMDTDEILRYKNANKPSAANESYRIPLNWRFDLIPPLALRRLAAIYEEGAQKYGPAQYLKKPLPDHVIYNHLVNHLLLWASGDKSEDNLAKVMWGVATLMALEDYNPNVGHDMTKHGAIYE